MHDISIIYIFDFMKLCNKYIDELIEIRSVARSKKDWALSDEIRNYLDNKLIFIFDTKDGQEIYYLTESYFKFKSKRLETMAMSNRQYVEHRIKNIINAEKMFDAWLYSIKSSK